MERGQRIALVAAALVVAVVAFLLLKPGDDDNDNGNDNASQPATQTGETKRGGDQTETQPIGPASVTIHVANGEPVGGVKEIDLTKGDRVNLTVVSDDDTSGEVHVHGADIAKDVPAGGSVKFSFTMDQDGVFEIELEETKTQIGELKVEP